MDRPATNLTSDIAYLGPPASYSHSAVEQVFGFTDRARPMATIADVFAAVASGHAGFGVVPWENSLDGRIGETYREFVRSPLPICGECILWIRHCLLSRGTETSIRRIMSRREALSQCRQWIARNFPETELVEATSTSAAAESAAGDESLAAIASPLAAVKYGLRILANGIQDEADLFTRFLALGHHSAEPTGDDRCFIRIRLKSPHDSWSSALSLFDRYGRRVTWLELHPQHLGFQREYAMFIEFDGHQMEPVTADLLVELATCTGSIEFFGSIPKWKGRIFNHASGD